MKRAEVLQEVRMMRFEDTYGRYQTKTLSCEDAAELLGTSVSTFYRMRQRYEEEGLSGLADRRLGKLSHRRAPVDEVMGVLTLFKTRYYDFTVKHFHEKLAGHGIQRSYTWTKKVLQDNGLVKKAPRRGAHRRKRPRRPLPGMMLHQDGSSHEWVPGKIWDLIVTMDDATSVIYSAFFVAEEGTMSSFLGLGEVIRKQGLFSSLYADRASHYWHTPQAGGQVDRTRPTQVGRALIQLGIELIPAYSPEARGRSERMFETLQNRLPQELRLHGITDMEEANRFLKAKYLPEHNRRFAAPATEEGSAFVPWVGGRLEDILSVQEERTVSNDNTVRYKGLVLQIPPDKHRYHYVKTRVRLHEYADGTYAVFHGPRKLAQYNDQGQIINDQQEAPPSVTPLAARH
ncbi:MAG: ISNCY family transposase [Deltaproteobacteria bacterium]|nr:ISNCY family transposase [Deltaproteobacteria bacterium]MBW2060521.1 ISNCY family transposase [Deltaproteobacteria bacterium]